MHSSPHPRRLGRYEVVDLLAQGGMAELFLARLPGIEGFAKRVVVKRVLPALARDREFVEMFLEEARLAATLHHQNVVQVHDIGHDDGGYFFAMEYLHGADLGEVLRALAAAGQELPLEIALEIARGACAGLHYAHQRTSPTGAQLGIVHRDVSPQNLFVTFDGGVKLLDFGIAKAVHQIASPYTRSGTLRGKLPYMSPEQCRGEPIDRRSDAFSLAVVIWEMTVGERLYGADGQGDFEVLKAIVERDAPRPSSRSASYPPALEAIVMKGLCRDRAARYQTCDELQAELETFVRGTGRWATARDVAAFMRGLFADRAASSLQMPKAATEPDAAPEGAIVPFPITRIAPVKDAEPEPLAPERVTAAVEAAPASVPPRPAPAAAPAAPPHVAAAPPVARAGASVMRIAALIVVTVAVTALVMAIGYRFGARSDPAAPGATGSGATAARPGASGAARAGATGPTGATAKPAEDALWFQPDDYLIAAEPYKDGRMRHVTVAKRMTEPDVRGEAEFLTADGKAMTTRHHWQTHVAAVGELTLGRLAFCKPHSEYDPEAPVPTTKAEARQDEWIAGRVTDVAELAAGRVTVADCTCELAGVRVVDEP